MQFFSKEYKLLLTLIGASVSLVTAQDVIRARKMVDTLASVTFHGRGYVNGGDSLAADFLGQQYDQLGLNSFEQGRFQPFVFPVNTFPGEMMVQLGRKKLKSGEDFILDPASKGIKGTFKLFWLDSLSVASYSEKPIELPSGKRRVPAYRFTGKMPAGLQKKLERYPAVLRIQPKKLTFSVAQQESGQCVVEVLASSVSAKSRRLKLHIQNEYVPEHQARNVIGYLEGTRRDSFVVVTAHYDHLGQLGKEAYFPGANDNASGTALLLELAAYYAKPENRLPYTVVFISFAGEEAGLLGSRYFVENPYFSLSKIKFLLNLDLMGSGKDGLTVVNGKVHQKDFALLDILNRQQQGFSKLVARGKAANSDHYPFSERQVPAFFMYTMGEITAYHDVHDKASVVTFSKFKEVLRLIAAFIQQITTPER